MNDQNLDWLTRTNLFNTFDRLGDDPFDSDLDVMATIEAPLLPLRDLVLFPNMATPLFVGRNRSIRAIDAATQQSNQLIVTAQRDPDVIEPTPNDLYPIGTEVLVSRTLHLPDGTTSILAQGNRRIQIIEYVHLDPYIRVRAKPIFEVKVKPPSTQALMRAVLALFEKCVQLDRSLPEDAYIYALNINEPGWLADMVAQSLDLDLAYRQEILELLDPAARLQRLSSLLAKKLDLLELEDQIHLQVQREVDKSQREFFLREQMKAIQGELGEGDLHSQEIAELRQKVAECHMPEEVQAKAERELARLAAMPSMAPEVGIIRTYLDWLIELPWFEATEDNLDISHVAQVLDNHHYGLPKAKERILEYIAVRQLAADKMRSPILCFVGPPGTGKTSLGKSIAKALEREFVRVSLGGVRDEAEIRGHRRTYIGALPGRIIQTMRRAGSVNPLFMLDEIDKLGRDFRGDPSAALLEVLDPEQNHAFSDHYLDVNYDLSKVMFITTANILDPIPPALQDRMEVIEFSGYTEEEKVNIAQQFLIPRQLEEHGLDDKPLRFSASTLQTMIRDYTFEAGVRNLEREIANVCRKTARQVAEGKRSARRITSASLNRYLGPPRFNFGQIEDSDQIGVATGVAWTEAGGDLMAIEVSTMPGKGNLMLTGQLGDVMQESAQAALSFTRARAKKLAIKPKCFDTLDIHIHVPEGAIPKDGPSAGITMATALISALSKRLLRRDVAMTGEITLRGRVLPVGGIKEKVLAAHRAGIKHMIIPKQNDKDLVDVPKQVQRDLDLILVKSMDEVLETALLAAPPKKTKESA